MFIVCISFDRYYHHKHVVHRDLKLENILLDVSSVTGAVNLKLTDFGLSNRSQPGLKLKDIAGTPTYMAPEMVHTITPCFSFPLFLLQQLIILAYDLLDNSNALFAHDRTMV